MTGKNVESSVGYCTNKILKFVDYIYQQNAKSLPSH